MTYRVIICFSALLMTACADAVEALDLTCDPVGSYHANYKVVTPECEELSPAIVTIEEGWVIHDSHIDDIPRYYYCKFKPRPMECEGTCSMTRGDCQYDVDLEEK